MRLLARQAIVVQRVLRARLGLRGPGARRDRGWSGRSQEEPQRAGCSARGDRRQLAGRAPGEASSGDPLQLAIGGHWRRLALSGRVKLLQSFARRARSAAVDV